MPAKTSSTQPRQASDVEHWHMETDVAIAGFGGAGGCAAIEAADAGAEVIIFEQASAGGGSTALSSAEIYMGGSGGARVQRACGFEDSTEDMFTYMMMCAGPQADEAKIRNYCENSVGHFNWLCGLGVPFKDSFHQTRAIMCLTDDGLLYTGSENAYPFSERAKPAARGHNLYMEGDVTVRSCRYFGPEVAAARRSVRPVPDRACGSASVRANRVAMRFQCPTPFLTLVITPLRSASIAIWQALRTAPYRHDRTVARRQWRPAFHENHHREGTAAGPGHGGI